MVAITLAQMRPVTAQPGGGMRIIIEDKGHVPRLDIDPKSHPAWTGVQRILDPGGQVAKFNKKFAGIGLRKGT